MAMCFWKLIFAYVRFFDRTYKNFITTFFFQYSILCTLLRHNFLLKIKFWVRRLPAIKWSLGHLLCCVRKYWQNISIFVLFAHNHFEEEKTYGQISDNAKNAVNFLFRFLVRNFIENYDRFQDSVFRFVFRT